MTASPLNPEATTMAIDRTLSKTGLKQHQALSFWSEPSDTLDRIPDAQRSLKDNGFTAQARRRGTQS
jgi:hypothetical protein